MYFFVLSSGLASYVGQSEVFASKTTVFFFSSFFFGLQKWVVFFFSSSSHFCNTKLPLSAVNPNTNITPNKQYLICPPPPPLAGRLYCDSGPSQYIMHIVTSSHHINCVVTCIMYCDGQLSYSSPPFHAIHEENGKKKKNNLMLVSDNNF